MYIGKDVNNHYYVSKCITLVDQTILSLCKDGRQGNKKPLYHT